MRRIFMLLSIPAALWLATLAVVYTVLEWRMRHPHDVPLLPLTPELPADPVAGMHMAKVVGCWAGCHGVSGEGGADVVERIHSITAPTLSEVVPLYGDEELARLVRFGVKRDGRSAVGMRAGVLWPMGDQDLANILRTCVASRPRRPSRATTS